MNTDAGTTAELHPTLNTRFCELVGCRYPVVQTGMGWVSGASLTAATSAAGGFGILAAATMTLPELEAAIAKVKARTSNPFGVNMRADQPDVMDRAELLIREGVRLASFAGPPNKPVIAKLKDKGILTMPTVGLPKHAVKMVSWGVDAVIAQGHEGGGHTGPVPTSLLLPAVCRAVDIPVLGAGGFKDGAGLVAALAWGADGIAMGTRFLLTQESQVPDHIKQAYLDASLTGTTVTTAIDGAPQRVINTAMIQSLERGGPLRRFWRALVNAWRFRQLTGASVVDTAREAIGMKETRGLTWAQLAMAANAPMLTKASMVDGRAETGILPTGQVTGDIDALPAVAELLEQLMGEADTTLRRLCGG